MVPTIISHPKERKTRIDKLHPTEKHTRHLEASRKYYARNKKRIQEEQRLRTRKRRQKLREEKVEKEKPGIHLDVCPFCQCTGHKALDNDDYNRSVTEGDDDSEMESLA